MSVLYRISLRFSSTPFLLALTEEQMKGKNFIEELNKDNTETVWKKDEKGGYPILK